MEQGCSRGLAEQARVLQEILTKSPIVSEILRRMPQLEAPNCYLAGGCVAQSVWNELHGFEATYGIKDYDLIYYDTDISAQAQDAFIKKGQQLFSDIPVPVEVVNQARVYLWYEECFGVKIEQYLSAEDAITSWPITATCIGVRFEGDQFRVHAPSGLDDLFGLILRTNKTLNAECTVTFLKKSGRWMRYWPKLKLIS